MPTTTNITTSYAGEHAGKYVSAALLTANTIANNGVEVLPNIKFKQVVSKLSTDDLLKDATCDFTATSTINLTERIIQPKELQVNLALCKKDFRNTWQAMEMGASAHDVMPKSFEDYLLAHVANKVSAKNETNIWRGDGAVSGEFDGFAKLLSLDPLLPAAQEVTGIAVTSVNVQAELEKIVNAIPSTLYGQEGTKIYISQNIMRAYVRALGGFGANGLGANGVNNMGSMWYDNGMLSFDGVPLFLAQGLADNTAIATQRENMFFGTSLLSDLQEAKVIDMSEFDGSQNVRIVMRMFAGVQYATVEDIVTYGIVNAVN